MTMEERQFTKTSDAASSIAPDGNRRISGMLRAVEGNGGKRKKKREPRECKLKSKKAKTKKNMAGEVVGLASEADNDMADDFFSKEDNNKDDIDIAAYVEKIEAVNYVSNSEKQTTEVAGSAEPDAPQPDVIQLSDDELEVLGPLVEQLGQEEKAADAVRCSPKTLEEWDDYPLPSWMVQDSSDDDQGDTNSSPIKSPPPFVTLDVPAGGLDVDASKALKARLEEYREKYRRKRRKIKVDDGDDPLADGDDEFNFDMSEWVPGSAEFDGAVANFDRDEIKEAIRFPPPPPPPPPCEHEQLSPILSTQHRPLRTTVSTSTPNIVSASTKSEKKFFVTTPKKRCGGEVAKEDYDRDAKILLFDDSSFAAASQKHGAAEKLYTATQLTSLLNKTEATTVVNDATCHSAAVEASSRADSTDMFHSEDDDVFRDWDFRNLEREELIKEEKAKENRVNSFKMPDLGAFEEATSSKTPTGPSSKFEFQSKTNHSSSSSGSALKSVKESPLNSSVVILDSDDSPVARVRKRRRLAFEDSDVTRSQRVASQAPPRDDLQSSNHSENRGSSSAADISSSPVVRQKKSKSKRKFFNKFLDVEAEMSDDHEDDFSDDSETGSDMEKYEASFVDDVQQSQAFSTQQHANYLKSVRSPVNPRKREWRPRPITADIYSQAPPEDHSSYGDDGDSFVAGDDSDDVEMDSRLDELDLIAETDRTCRMTAPSQPKRPRRQKRKIDRGLMSSSSSEHESDAEPTQMPLAAAVKNDSTEKEARLRKQKELQEQFRKKMEEKKMQHKSDDDKVAKMGVAGKKTPPPKDRTGSVSSDITEERSPPEHSRPTVVVSTSEVHKTPEMISCLKHDHKLQIHVRYFEGATALVSPRMGVERRMLGEFCNGANRAKVLERCQKMNDLFERPCVILESDKPTEDGVFPRSIHIQGSHRTKYVDTLFSQLSESKIQLFFSEDQAQTAKIIAALTKRECGKGQEFPRPIKLTEFQEKVMMPFYQTIPGVSMGTALLLTSGFTSLSAFANASHSTIMRRAAMDVEKARKITEFVKKCLKNRLDLT